VPQQAARLGETLAPAWLIEAVRPRKAPVPWAAMIRAAVAICTPLAIGLAVHNVALALLPAIGGLIGTVVDIGGPYPARLRRVGSAAVFGGALGLTIGSLIHGRGWVAFVVVVAVAGVSALLSAGGSTASVTGLQLLVYTTFSTGPLGALRPWWHTPLLFLAGVAWSVLLWLPGWLVSPHAAEQRSIAAVYDALAGALRAAGTEGFPAARLAVTTALNTAYDQLLALRSASSGRDRAMMRLVALLTQSHLVTEAVATVALEGRRAPPEVISATAGVADAIRTGAPPPDPPAWHGSPGAEALTGALAGAARLLTTGRIPPQQQRLTRPSRSERLNAALDQIRGGRMLWIYAIRLMVCIGVASLLTDVLPLERSYWVVLTVAIVLRPDLGSVFARAVQRGTGTIVGAVLGAAILAVVPYGGLLLIPVAVLAALLPYGRSRNYGLMATFLTPLVVLLIDLPVQAGWQLAAARALDTVLGCGIVLVIGYAPWPMSWYAHLPSQFCSTVSAVCEYLDQALVARSPDRSRLRRHAYRALSDLRAEFQRTMAEPPGASRRATVWWPAVAGLEQVMDAAAATATAADHGAPLPPAACVTELTATLRRIADSVVSGAPPPQASPPPAPAAQPAANCTGPVADAVRRVQASFA
jgi:uncharacterized membrane protein YccC